LNNFTIPIKMLLINLLIKPLKKTFKEVTIAAMLALMIYWSGKPS